MSITCTFWVIFIEIDCKVMRDLQINGKKRRLLSEKLFQEGLWLNTIDISSVVNWRLSSFQPLSVKYSPSWSSLQNQSSKTGIKLVNKNNKTKQNNTKKTHPNTLKNHINMVSGLGYQCWAQKRNLLLRPFNASSP